MTKKKEMRRVDTIDGDDPWLAYWRWWYSDRPEARLELKLKLQASQQSSCPTSLKALMRRGLARFLYPLQRDPRNSH